MADTDSSTGYSTERRIDTVEHVPPSAVPTELERLERICGGWVNDRADQFEIHECETHDEHRVRRKAFTEMSIYLFLGDQLPVSPVAERSALRSVLVEQVNDPLYRQALQRNPLTLRAHGYPPIVARAAGELRDDATWRALGDLLEQDFVWAKERQPFATLDLWHMATLYGTDPLYDAETILQTSCLDRELHPVWAELKHIYPMTHNVMFYRGFGLDQFGFPSEPAPYDVGRSHVGLSLRFLAERKYDALAELLLSGVLQRQIPPDLVGLCLSRLVAVAESNGYVPDYTVDDDQVTTFNQENVEILDHLDDRAVDWGVQYHANVVAGYTALCVRAEWPALLEAWADRDPPDYDPADLLTLGDAFAKLASYDLKAGARALRAVAGTDAAAAYPAAFEAAVSFLRDQRRDDGQYGYWAEEQMEFERLGHDPAQFEERLISPSSEVCRRALEAIEDVG